MLVGVVDVGLGGWWLFPFGDYALRSHFKLDWVVVRVLVMVN